MKELIRETERNAFDTYLGAEIEVWCAGFFYNGRLIAYDEHNLKLEDMAVIYETGALQDAAYRDAQPTEAGQPRFIRIAAIEHWGPSNKRKLNKK